MPLCFMRTMDALFFDPFMRKNYRRFKNDHSYFNTHTYDFKCYKIAQKVVMEEIIFWKILYIKLNFLTGLFSTQLLVGCKHSIRLTRSSTDPHNKQKIPPKTKMPPKYLQKHCRGLQRELEDIEANVFFAEVFINFLRYFKLALK